MKYISLLFLLISIAFSSEAQTDSKARSYYCKEIGWTILVPDGWSVLSKEKQADLQNTGKKAMEKVTEEDIPTQRLKNLISFRRDPLNVFMSTIEPFTEDKPGEYEQNNRKIYGLIYSTFKNEGIKADTASGEEMIRGHKFYTFATKIYSKDGDLILQQKMFSRLVKGYDFGVTISYDNEQDKQAMLDAWLNSTEL